MNDRKTLAISEMKVSKWYEQGGLCLACGEPLAVQESELAHRIPNRKWTIAKWGPKVIHNPLNLTLTHPGKCNSAMSLGNHPIEMEKLAALIGKEKEK